MISIDCPSLARRGRLSWSGAVPGRIGFALGALLAVALAGCLGPGPVEDDGPPYVLTVENRYVPNVSQHLPGDRELPDDLERARLPNGTVATYPMYLRITVGDAGHTGEDSGRPRSEARSGWDYDDSCPQASPHAPRRIRDNECDGHPHRSRFVLPSLYPQDRSQNYSVDSIGWHGRGYEFDTVNDSRPWNRTKGFYAEVPVDTGGSVRLVFHHRMPLPIRVTAPGGELSETMDEEVIRPENCTSDKDEPYDYVKGLKPFSTVGEVDGAFDVDNWMLHGDARVVMEWSAVCVRDKRQVQV